MNSSITRKDFRAAAGFAVVAVALCLAVLALRPMPVSVQAPGPFQFQVDHSLATVPHVNSQA